MSPVAMAEAPSMRTLRSLKPAWPNLPSTADCAAPTMRSPRWPVANTATPAAASSAAAAIRMSLGEGPVALDARGLASAGPEAFSRGRCTDLGAAFARGFASTRDPPRTAAGIRVLRDPKHQTIEIHALLGRLLGDERSGRHAGLGVHLQKDQNVLNVVITEVGSGNPPATQGGV